MSAKTKVKKDYQIIPIRVSPEIKKKLRILAAEKDTSMANMAQELIALGLTVMGR